MFAMRIWQCIDYLHPHLQTKPHLIWVAGYLSLANPTPVIGCLEGAWTFNDSFDMRCILSNAVPANGGRFPGVGLFGQGTANMPAALTDL
jgi:hypothetical protein